MSTAARVLFPGQRPPDESQQERSRAVSLLGRGIGLLQRVPGYDWITLLLLGVMLATVAWSVQLAKWGDLPSIMPTILLGWAAAFLASRSRAPLAIKLTLAVVIGFAIIMWQGSIPADGSNVADRARDAWDRFWVWIGVARAAGISNDSVPFALMFMTASWITGYTVTALTFRFRNPWAPVILLSVGLLNNLSFRPGLYEHTFFIFILAAVALFAHLTSVRRITRWNEQGIRYPKSVHWLSMRDGVIFGVIVVAIAAILPLWEPRSGSLDRTWEKIKSPIIALEDPASRLLAGVKAQQGSRGLSVPGEALSFQGPIHLTEEPLMWVTSRYAIMMPGGVYEHYTSAGWITQPRITLEVAALDPLSAAPVGEERERIQQLIQPLVNTELVLPVGGVYAVDRAAEAEYLAPSRHLFSLTGSVSPLAALPPDIRDLAFQLRFALRDAAARPGGRGDVPLSAQPLMNRAEVEAVLERMLPDDLRATVITENSLSDLVQGIRVERVGPPEQVGVRFDEPMRAENLYQVTTYVSTATEADLASSGDDYPGWVTDRYLQLAPTLPAEVRELANAIVREAGARTPYQKVSAVQNFLRSQEYSQEIKGPAANVDGIYYMLFQTQNEPCPSVNPGCDVRKIKAYSQYFGSAGAVLLRAVGVPTRMIVGWGTGEYVPEVGKFLVRDEDRHGWTQVYFEGYGWVDIEMTPGRDEPEAGVQYPVEPLRNPTSGPAAVGSSSEELLFPEDLEDTSSLSAAALAALARQREAQAADDRSIPVTPIIVLASIIGLLALLYAGWVLIHRGMRPGQRSYTKMVRAGRLLGVRRSAWQTPSEFAANVAAAAPGVADSAELIAIGYERERYANGGATAASSENLDKHWRKVFFGLLGHRLRLLGGAGRREPQEGRGHA